MGSFDLFCPYLNGELLKNWEQCEVRIHVVHIIVKLITLMFLHRKRNVPYNWSQIWQLPQSNFKCFIPFIVFNSVSRIKHAKKEKKGILGGFYHTARQVLLSHCKTGARVMHFKNQWSLILSTISLLSWLIIRLLRRRLWVQTLVKPTLTVI